MIESAKYTERRDIEVVIDGTTTIVPDTMDNRDRRKLAEWEAAGNTIQPYVKPPPSEYQTRLEAFSTRTDVSDLRDKLQHATPEQIDTWLLNNVTNLAQARAVLAIMLKYMVTRL